MNHKISVVTVCYNAAETIEETMLSVLNQTYDNVEYIIIDGGSTDGTVDIIKKYADRLAYWVSEPDKGIYDAMNKGIAVATGDYINFMNAGDRFFECDTISKISPFMQTHPIIVYGDWIESFNGQMVEKKALPLTHLRKGMAFPHQSAFIQNSYHKSKPYDTRYRIAADYNLFYNACVNNERFEYADITVSVYDMTPSKSISLKNYKYLIQEHLQISGSGNSITLGIKRMTMIMDYYIRTQIKKILPQSVVHKIKRYLNRH